jgi:hypothetical protein
MAAKPRQPVEGQGAPGAPTQGGDEPPGGLGYAEALTKFVDPWLVGYWASIKAQAKEEAPHWTARRSINLSRDESTALHLLEITWQRREMRARQVVIENLKAKCASGEVVAFGIVLWPGYGPWPRIRVPAERWPALDLVPYTEQSSRFHDWKREEIVDAVRFYSASDVERWTRRDPDMSSNRALEECKRWLVDLAKTSQQPMLDGQPASKEHFWRLAQQEIPRKLGLDEKYLSRRSFNKAWRAAVDINPEWALPGRKSGPRH